ncbi:MFS transporter [Nocardioides sp. zg-1230]|nr:MFS transporter [Nocardioides sp. zg-1230]
MDMVDIYLPVIALAPAIAYFQPETLAAGQAGTLFFVTFAATLLGRPVGALIFGHLADTIGRRRVTLASIAGFSVCTILIGLLPGHATWGLAAPAALIGLRFLDGIFLGGEYTAATPLAFEHCPPRARALFGGLLMSAYAAAYAAVSALVLVLLLVLPAGAYQAWGWRVPFLAGGLAGLVFLLWRTRVPESPLWEASAASRQGYEGCGDAGGDLRAFARQAPVQVLLSGVTARLRSGSRADGRPVAGRHQRRVSAAAAPARAHWPVPGLGHHGAPRRATGRDRWVRSGWYDQPEGRTSSCSRPGCHGVRDRRLHLLRPYVDASGCWLATRRPGGGDRADDPGGVGSSHLLRQRALRHERPRHGVRHGVQPGARPGQLLCVLPDRAHPADARTSHPAHASWCGQPDGVRRSLVGPGDT